VLDFGIARVRDAMSNDKTMTGSGVLLGTPGFMSPEQALGQHDGVDARTDLWAAAATFFKLVSGKLVHSGENSTQLMLAAATKMPRSIATVADVPSPIARVIDRALDFDIGSRWSSAEEMRRALYAATSESFGAAPSRATLAAGKLPTGGANPTEMSRPSLPTPNITEPPVSTMTPYFEPTYAPPPKPRSLLVPIISVAAIFGLVCFVGIRVLDRAATSSPSEPSAVPMAIAPASTTPPVQTTATPTAEPTAATDDSTARRSSGKKPTGAASGASTAIRARPVAAPLTNCDPPYYFNANNDKVFKKECL
jgi:serine/threonine-protein kinase